MPAKKQGSSAKKQGSVASKKSSSVVQETALERIGDEEESVEQREQGVYQVVGDDDEQQEIVNNREVGDYDEQEDEEAPGGSAEETMVDDGVSLSKVSCSGAANMSNVMQKNIDDTISIFKLNRETFFSCRKTLDWCSTATT